MRTFDEAEVICLKCLTVAKPLCDCGNVGVIRDRDNDINIYVENIKTCRLADTVYVDGVEIHRELHEPFDTMMFVDYYPIRSTPLNFVDQAPKKVKKPDRLREALDNYSHTIAAEKRMGTTRKRLTRRNNER